MEHYQRLWIAVTLLPLLGFIFIYMSGSDFVYSIIFALLLVGLSFVKKISIRYLLLLNVTVSFLLYAFYALGSREAPQNFETFTQKGRVATFTFAKPEKIDQFCYYVGIDKTVNFHLKHLGENQKWEKIYEYKENFPFSFRWRCEDINVTSSQITLNLDKSAFMLGEVRFLHKGNPIAYTSTHATLNNNPDMAIDTGYFGGMFFDEIYHGRTAYEIIHGLKIYETTHPYLGKLLISFGIELFDMTPFGWRFSNVIVATLLIIVAYFFALRLFREERYALVMAFMVTYSFMHLTEARGAFIDTFGVLFVLISYLYLYRFLTDQKLKYLILSGIFFGLAGAIKWSALFASIGYLFIAIYLLLTRYPLDRRFKGYRLILYGLMSYIGVAGVVYMATFYDIYLRGGESFQAIIDYQINMYKYHSALTSTHAYSSPWWSWMIDFRPMCFRRDVVDGISSSITVFGNPALFWTGTVATFYMIYLLIRRRETLESVVILFAFMGLLLPYAFVGRSMFIYHFYYAVPFMFLATVYMWRDLICYSEKFWKLLVVFLIIVASLFLLFYPVLSGYEVPRSYVDNYLVWFNGWWL